MLQLAATARTLPALTLIHLMVVHLERARFGAQSLTAAALTATLATLTLGCVQATTRFHLILATALSTTATLTAALPALVGIQIARFQLRAALSTTAALTPTDLTTLLGQQKRHGCVRNGGFAGLIVLR